jgi:CRISPR system Cascade subunit CasB
MMEQRKLPDFMALYNAWEQLSPGPKAELRRVAKPDELVDVPAFYRLFSGKAHTEWEKQAFQRLIYCLPYIKHTNDNVGLGKALAKESKVSEKRLFQVIRSDTPNDMIQLRRIVQMADPSVNWSSAAKSLWYWNDRSKRDLLEDYFINLPK